MKRESLAIFVPAVITTALWGSAIPAVKIGYVLFSIETAAQRLAFAGVRFTAAGLLVLLFTLLQRKAPRALWPETGLWRGILALAATQTAIQYIFYYLGLANTTGVKGSVLSATATFFSVIIAHFLYASDRMTARRAAGCLIGFAGVVLVVSSGAGFDGGFHFTGEGFLLISAISQGVGAVIAKRVSAGRDPVQITGWQLLLGGLALLLSGALMGGLSFQATPAGLLLLGYMTALSAVAFTLWTMLLQKHPVGKVTVYSFLIPVFGAALSGLFLRENVLTLRNLAALVLVAIGIFTVNRAAE